MKKVLKKGCFYVPDNSENFNVCLKKIIGGGKVVFGEKSCKEQGNETVYPLNERVNLFIWKVVAFGNHDQLSVDKVEYNS